MTLLGKSGRPVRVATTGGESLVVAPARGIGSWTGVVPAPPGGFRDRVCVFEISSDGLVGSTRIEYVR